MSELAIRDTPGIPDDVWAWWQARRLRYNIALAGAGWAAYLLTVGLHALFADPVWADWREALSVTVFLGALFLIVMGVANILYLLGPFGESVLRPADVGHFRRTAYAMGFWGSVALPFLFPLINLASLIGSPGS